MSWKEELCKCKQSGILHMEISYTDYENLSQDQKNNGTVYFVYFTDEEGEKTGKGVIYRYEINFVSALTEEIYNAGMQDPDNQDKGEIFNIYEGENKNVAAGESSHAEGLQTTASGDYSHSEGWLTTSSGESSHAEGNNTTSSGESSHAEGDNTVAYGINSHAEGNSSQADGDYSHAEGFDVDANGDFSHSEGYSTTTNGDSSHAEGYNTTANGDYSHAEGYNTTTQSDYSHVEGYESITNGEASHSEGYNTRTEANYSHAEGYNTRATGQASHASGEYNAPFYQNENNQLQPYLFTVGNGIADNVRSNAIAIDYSGNTTITGQYKDQTGVILVPVVPIDIGSQSFITDYTDIAGFLASADARSDVFYAFYDSSQI